MSEYLIRRSISLKPIERITLVDTTTTADFVHSTIDKTLASTIIESFGTTVTDIKYKAYLTTTNDVALSAATIFNVTGAVTFVFIRIVSAGSSGTPNVSVTFNSIDHPIGLSGAEDFCALPLKWDNQDLSNIKIASSGATTVANVEIMVGL